MQNIKRVCQHLIRENCMFEVSSFTINIKAARDFCPDVICRHLNVNCNCGLLSIALGSEDTYVDFPSERYSLTPRSHAGHSLPTFKMTKSATHTTSNIVFDRHKYVFIPWAGAISQSEASKVSGYFT